MRRIVATVAAGLMIAGGAVLSAPAATAYPAGAAPGAAIEGSTRLAPGTLSTVRAFNFKPGCTATIKFTRAPSPRVLAQRTRIIQADRTTTYAFRAPARPGLYVAKVKQNKTASCAGFSAITKFRVIG